MWQHSLTSVCWHAGSLHISCLSADRSNQGRPFLSSSIQVSFKENTSSQVCDLSEVMQTSHRWWPCHCLLTCHQLPVVILVPTSFSLILWRGGEAQEICLVRSAGRARLMEVLLAHDCDRLQRLYKHSPVAPDSLVDVPCTTRASCSISNQAITRVWDTRQLKTSLCLIM